MFFIFCFLSLSTWPPLASIVAAYGGTPGPGTPVSRASVTIVVTGKWMKLFLPSGKWQYKKSKRELDRTEGREWKVGISQPGADWESICSLLSVLSQKLIWRVPARTAQNRTEPTTQKMHSSSSIYFHGIRTLPTLSSDSNPAHAEASYLISASCLNATAPFSHLVPLLRTLMACTRCKETHYPVVWGAFHALVAVHFVDTDLQMIAAMDLSACLKDTRVWRVWFVFCCVLEDVCVCATISSWFLCFSGVFFSADNKESGKASFSTAVIPTGALAAVTVTLSCKRGNFFFLSGFRFIYLFIWFIFSADDLF